MNLLFFTVLTGVVQGFFLAFLIFKMKTGNHNANKFLSAYVTSVSFSIGISTLTRLFPETNSLLHILFRSQEAIQFIFGPLIYFFVRSLVVQNPSNIARRFPHFLPAILYIFFMFSTYIPFVNQRFLVINPEGNRFHITLEIVSSLHVWIYLLKGLLISYKAKKNTSMSVSIRTNASFSMNLLIGTAIVYLVFLFILCTSLLQGFDYDAFNAAVGLAGAIALYSVSYFFLINAGSLSRENKNKYSNSPLSSKEKEFILTSLIELLETKHVYLNPEINLNSVSRSLNTPRQYISQIIGERMNTTFNDLINKYRVETFVKRIEKGDHRKYNLLALAFDSGFNSKTAFLSAFRKNYGKTPSDYIKSLII